MVTGWIMQVLTDVLTFALGLIPHIDRPTWTGTIGGFLTQAMSDLYLMGWWFPVPTIISAAGVMFSMWLVAIGVRLSRIGLSFFTAGGGSSG